MNSDHELFRSIYVHYRPLLRTVAKRNGIPYDELDDIVQETFESYYSRYPVDWSEAQIRGMLMKILKCRCMDYMRKQKRLPVTYLDPTHIEDGGMVVKRNHGKDAFETLLDEQKYQKIMDALKGMKPDWSEVFIRLTIEGRSIAEVSEELGISEAACRARHSRANRYLRTQLSGYEPQVMKQEEKQCEKKARPSPKASVPEPRGSEKTEWGKEIRQSSPGPRSIGPPRECLS